MEKKSETELIEAAKSGDQASLNNLIKKYQNWVFNVALAFVSDRDHAADITQEVLIKVITHLSSFKIESNFRTWLFKIVKNHFLNMKRKKFEANHISFDCYAEGLDQIVDQDIDERAYKIERENLIEEAKISCLRGMLLCLTREQRLIYILGDIFELPDRVGGEIMEISKGNFRVKLHRARTDIFNFMNSKCGLININNPCRCAKKTEGFIKLGFVDPINLHFQKDIIDTVKMTSKRRLDSFEESITSDFSKTFKNLPHLEAPVQIELLQEIISSKAFNDIFNLG